MKYMNTLIGNVSVLLVSCDDGKCSIDRPRVEAGFALEAGPNAGSPRGTTALE